MVKLRAKDKQIAELEKKVARYEQRVPKYERKLVKYEKMWASAAGRRDSGWRLFSCRF